MYFINANHHIRDASLNIALETYLVENRLEDEPILPSTPPPSSLGGIKTPLPKSISPIWMNTASKWCAECRAAARCITI